MRTPWPDRCLVLSEVEDRQSCLSGTGTGRIACPPLAVFTDAELAEANAFKLPKRRDEWLLSRAAAKQLAVQLGLATDPREVTVDRPFLVIGGARSGHYVSLSHSTPYAAAAIAREPVGIDIQVIRDISDWSTHLFLVPEEDAAMRRCTLPHRVLHFWCAKEAAFKQRSDDFTTMRQLRMELFEERADGLLFDAAETVQLGDVILAITRPTSSAAP
jgi:4'-phosphopantetheinyl transferase EntD